ncbi:transglycosylase domain-containing protein [Nitrincola sp. A-D6]|uniref:transglycosylase domain-containing protein n=1 Tax=Nitrincola sp. A-D6 TaxID=1545442 RepID=UPI0022868164|nr:biosynthetic peptidoglycan transglycosylase [Nitrincola sp. A-D6]
MIVVEDREYYQHFGISPKGMLRAAIVNARAGRFVQGGSTLTQQLIKNFYLSSDRTLSRKLLELPMALAMDFRYSKDEILEAYLNEVYLGSQASELCMALDWRANFISVVQPLSSNCIRWL